MIENGANCFDDGLIESCEAGHTKVADRLIERAMEFEEYLPYNACLFGRMSVVRFLIASDPSYVNNALEMACVGGHLAVVEFLLSNGADGSIYGLNEACAADKYNAGHPPIVRRLIAEGATNVNFHLTMAASRPDRNDEIVAILLQSATNAAAVFDIERDAAWLLRLLTTTDLPRARLSSVPGIGAIFAAADRIVADVLTCLDGVGWPSVLQRIVAEYCVNPT
jgi:hypothetical protein